MPRLRLAVCHLCQRRLPLEQMGWSDVARVHYCPPTPPGSLDRCIFIAARRLGVPAKKARRIARRS